MPHFFIPPENITGGAFSIAGDEAHHLINVRRVKINDELSLFDGTGKVYRAKIEKILAGGIYGVILSEIQGIASRSEMTLYAAAPKGERLDWMVEKLSELGVSSFVPLVTQRSVIKGFSEQKYERLKRICAAAAEQSLRPDIMQILPPRAFFDAVSGIRADSLSLIPWEGAEETEKINTVWHAFKKTKHAQPKTEINVFIGPEGGYTMQEITTARNKGIIPVSLGKGILRVETAAIKSVIVIQQSIDMEAG